MIAYLDEHGINGVMAGHYRLGLVAEPLPGDERFRGALAIPYLSPRGVKGGGVAAMRYRVFGRDSKIAQHKGQKSRLYNTQASFDAFDSIGLCEGEMDAIAATEHLGLPTMAVPGVENFKAFWAPIFKDYTKVFIFGDGDQAGREFAQEMAELIGWRARIVPMPDGEDVASLAAKDALGSTREVISTTNQES